MKALQASAPRGEAAGPNSARAVGGAPKLRWLCRECGAPMECLDETLNCSRCSAQIRQVDGIWRGAPDFVPPGFAPERRDHLAEIETRHFWFKGRERLLGQTLDLRVPNGGAALELGCGSGGFLPRLCGRFSTVVGVDAYGASLAAARSRAPDATILQADASRVPLADGQFDLVVALDVLEHVAPAPFLAEARRLLVPHGHLLLTVPACPSLWSPLDVAMGHRCRYDTAALHAELNAAGFRVIHETHYQFLLFPLFWVARRLASGGMRRAERQPNRAAGWLLGAINEAEVRWLSRWRLPWGSSLLALAQHEP